ncbi:MAG: MBL fold metallo-hydrolase [Gammaproteobacteria bacterium]|nr:MBL fold metallo-hydrolase [Gammaproteobacteria bacterium]
MLQKGYTLFDNGSHKVIVFNELVSGAGIQANQFLVINDGEGALIDPGGDLTHAPLTNAIKRHIPIENLRYIFASHQDPDIISSMGRWLMQTNAEVVTSKLWSRFLPHLVPGYMQGNTGQDLEARIIPIGDEGGAVTLGGTKLHCVPGHFLHSVGNFHFYDEISKVLFSGDVGASVGGVDESKPVEDFQQHVGSMEGFHKRYMCSNKVLRLWTQMIRGLEVDYIVPQHGAYFDKHSKDLFLNWLDTLQCGVDIVGQEDYSYSPKRRGLNF